MQPPRVRDAAEEVDEIGAPPAQLLREVFRDRVRGDGVADRIQRRPRTIPVLHDLAREEAVLAVLDRDAQDTAVLEDELELYQHRSAIGGEATGEAHHR